MKLPSSRGARIAIQVLASAAGGVILAVIGGLTGSLLWHGSPGGYADLIAGALLSAAGYVVGAGLTASWAGARLQLPTPWWLALPAGLGAAILVLVLAEPLRLNQSTQVLEIVLGAAVALAAALVPRLAARRG